MAYIVKNNEVIATVNTELKSGVRVEYAHSKCAESIDASREFNLVNSSYGKISRAKKWDKEHVESHAVEINSNEFFVS